MSVSRLSVPRLVVAFAAGTVAALALAVAATAALSLAPAPTVAGTGVALGPLTVFSVTAAGSSTVATLGPGAVIVCLALGAANAAGAAVLARSGR